MTDKWEEIEMAPVPQCLVLCTLLILLLSEATENMKAAERERGQKENSISSDFHNEKEDKACFK